MNFRKPLLDEYNIGAIVLANYGLCVDEVEKINRGMMSNCYKIFAGGKQYFLKEPLIDVSKISIEEEAQLTYYLKSQLIPVAEFIKTLEGKWSFEYRGRYISLQEYIDGNQYRTFELPEKFLLPSLDMLGQIDKSLANYEPELKTKWDLHYCEAYDEAEIVRKLEDEMRAIAASGLDFDKRLKLEKAVEYVAALQPRMKEFGRYFKYTTYTGTHGDYHAGNIIYGESEILAVIDSNKSSRKPAIINLMHFYTKASHECKRVSSIDVTKLAEGMRAYERHVPLTYYDYKFMPYIYLHLLVRFSLPNRIRRCVQYSKFGNDRLAKGSMRGLMWNLRLARYLNANADIISRKLEKHYEQNLSKDELKQHRRWLYKQESAFRRRRLFRKVVPLWIRRAGRKVLSDN